MSYNTRIVEEKPYIGIITPVEGEEPDRDKYIAAIKSLGEQGATRVITDLSGPQRGKITYAYLRPNREEALGVTEVYLAGISAEDIWHSVISSRQELGLRNSPGITRTLEEAIAKCG